MQDIYSLRKNKGCQSPVQEQYPFHINDTACSIEFNNWCTNTAVSSIVSTANNNVCLVNIILGPQQDEPFAGLCINYSAPMYAADKFTSKRERITDNEILISRMVDKALRPIIGEYEREITINIRLLKYKGINIEAFITNAAIFTLRKLFPVEAVMIFHNLNPGRILITANKNQIFMVDQESAPINTNDLVICYDTLLQKAHHAIGALKKIQPQYKKTQKELIIPKDLKYGSISEIRTQYNISFEEARKLLNIYMYNNNYRVNRTFETIREIRCDDLPVENGAVFTRGTQKEATTAMCMVTMGKEPVNEGSTKNIICHYIFHGFSVGGKGSNSLSRREIGHSDIIRKAIQYVVDPKLVVRLVCEIMSSNGSSSMASVCAAILALAKMGLVDRIVAGITIGHINNGKKSKFLVDITAAEDNISNMDFKVTGTTMSAEHRNYINFTLDEKTIETDNNIGITSISMDAKAPIWVEKTTLKKLFTLCAKSINAVIKPMKNSPVLKKTTNTITVEVPKNKVGLIIGTNGAVIKQIIKLTKCKIKVSDSGLICISGPNYLEVIKILRFASGAYKVGDKVILFAVEDSKEHDLYTVNGFFTTNRKNIKAQSIVYATITGDKILKINKIISV